MWRVTPGVCRALDDLGQAHGCHGGPANMSGCCCRSQRFATLVYLPRQVASRCRGGPGRNKRSERQPASRESSGQEGQASAGEGRRAASVPRLPSQGSAEAEGEGQLL